MNNNPLISIAVITYNSSDFVLETLESCKNQTYQNIELIVSDDCSTDNTVEICQEWMQENNGRFIRTEIIASDHNTGIPANYNRGCKAAKGEWIKPIGGDDALEDYYCEKIADYINTNPDALCIVTNVTLYQDSFIETNIIRKSNSKQYRMYKDNITAEEQYQCLLRNGLVHTAGEIFNKRIFEETGYFNEKYLYHEDRPFWLKITKAGIKIHLLEIYGAKYRVHAKSAQKSKNRELWSKCTASSKQAYKDRLPEYPFFERLLRRYVLSIEYCYYKLFKNTKFIFISAFVFLITLIPNIILRQINRKYRWDKKYA